MLNLIEMKKTVVEIERFLERVDMAMNAPDHEVEFHAYMVKRTSVDAERALKQLRKSLLTLTPVETPAPVPVPTPEVTDVTADVV